MVGKNLQRFDNILYECFPRKNNRGPVMSMAWARSAHRREHRRREGEGAVRTRRPKGKNREGDACKHNNNSARAIKTISYSLCSWGLLSDPPKLSGSLTRHNKWRNKGSPSTTQEREGGSKGKVQIGNGGVRKATSLRPSILLSTLPPSQQGTRCGPPSSLLSFRPRCTFTPAPPTALGIIYHSATHSLTLSSPLLLTHSLTHPKELLACLPSFRVYRRRHNPYILCQQER